MCTYIILYEGIHTLCTYWYVTYGQLQHDYIFYFFLQWRKRMEGGFVPSNMKNLLVTGIFGDKVCDG